MEQKKGLGLWALVALALGTVVGAGVVTLTGQAIAVTGKSAWLAYLVATAAGFLMIVPYALLGNCMIPKGGNYTITATLLGDRWGGFIGISAVLIIFNMGLFGSGFGQYVNVLFPAVSVKTAALAGITFFFLLNLTGVQKMAKVQNLLSVILFVGLGLFILLGITKTSGKPMDFAAPDFFTNGAGGFGAAVMLLVASTVGHKNIINFTSEAQNPKRDVPKALAITSAIILVLYIGIAFVNSGVLPVEQVAGKPLTEVAKVIMPGALYYLFIIGGPLASLSTTINSAFAIMSTPIKQAARDGWFPEKIAAVNKNGIPYIIYILVYLVGILPILLNLSIKVITSNVVLIVSINELIVFLAICRLPKMLPEAWEKRYYKVKEPVFYIGVGLAILLRGVFIALSLKNLTPVLAATTLGLFVIFFIYATALVKAKKVNVKKSYEIESNSNLGG
ncbi:APC family permease [Clostridium sp. AN503]|uniref:APC family permease n=1 Tax=Clostridium sp. AN503 TaxID=3160598 RepID=UPI0034596B1B